MNASAPAPRLSVLPTIEEVLAPYQSIALVLQGGGALGAYQAGVFEALSEANIQPRWLSGVSIGAINAAIIAGNEPGAQLDRLRAFWELVSSRKVWHYTPEGDIYRTMRNQASAWMTMFGGLPGFFTARMLNPWCQLTGAGGATSFYDTGELANTLNRLIDWTIINNQERRLSVGAVNVRTGNFRYFDTALERIGPEHIMASGALPPAFPRSASRTSTTGTAASFRTRRCSTCWSWKRSTTPWSSRWISSVPAATCHATCRRCWPATRTSCIQAGPATTRTRSAGCTMSACNCATPCCACRRNPCAMRTASSWRGWKTYPR